MFTYNFLANSADRPRIWANLITIRPNPGTISWIHQKVACALLVIGTHEISCSQHKQCPASNTENVLLRTQRMSCFEQKECLASNTRKFVFRTQGMSCLEHKECPAWNTRSVLRGTQGMMVLRHGPLMVWGHDHMMNKKFYSVASGIQSIKFLQPFLCFSSNC